MTWAWTSRFDLAAVPDSSLKLPQRSDEVRESRHDNLDNDTDNDNGNDAPTGGVTQPPLIKVKAPRSRDRRIPPGQPEEPT
jgi:hypothetical protein